MFFLTQEWQNGLPIAIRYSEKNIHHVWRRLPTLKALLAKSAGNVVRTHYDGLYIRKRHWKHKFGSQSIPQWAISRKNNSGSYVSGEYITVSVIKHTLHVSKLATSRRKSKGNFRKIKRKPHRYLCMGSLIKKYYFSVPSWEHSPPHSHNSVQGMSDFTHLHLLVLHPFLHPHFTRITRASCTGGSKVQTGSHCTSSSAFFHPQSDGGGSSCWAARHWPQMNPAKKWQLFLRW